MVTLTQLEYLLAVDHYRHFAKAAEACNVTQPSLSMQLAKLEDEWNLILFDRSKKPILVTEQGKELIQQARVVLREHQNLMAMAKQVQGQLSGVFRLGVIPTLSPYLIPLFLKQFSEDYPQVELIVDERQTSDCLRDLDEDKLDGALLATPLSENDFFTRNLFYEPFYLYVHPDHPLSKKASVSETDLNGNDVWLLDEGHCLRSQVISLCSVKSRNQANKHVRFESGNLETLRQLVRSGQGYTLLPQLFVSQLSQKENKEFVRPFKKPAPTREISLIYRRSHWKAEILSVLEKLILTNIPPEIRKLRKEKLEVIAAD